MDLKKIKIILFIPLALFFIANLLYFPVLPVSAITGDTPKWENPFDKLQVTIPGMAKFSDPAKCPDDASKMCIPWIGEYIVGIYKYAVGVAGILATVIIMWGGLIWLTAGGNVSRVTEAKTWIGGSVTGLVLVLCSYMILYEINPDLTRFKSIKVSMVKEDKSIGIGSGDQYCEKKVVLTCGDGWIDSDESKCSRSTNSSGSTVSTVVGEVPLTLSPQGLGNTKPDDSSESSANQTNRCCCKSGINCGRCKSVDKGLCAVNVMMPFFGQYATQASAICNVETSNGRNLSNPGVFKNGEACSVGLFQINMPAHCSSVGFKKAFLTSASGCQGAGDPDQIIACRAYFMNHVNNIEKAYKIFTGAGGSGRDKNGIIKGWTPWGSYKNVANPQWAPCAGCF